MLVAQSGHGDRVKAALGAAALQLLFAYALLTGLAVEMPAAVRDRLIVFGIAPPPPSPPPRVERSVPRRTESERPQGGSSPPGLRARPTEVVAPAPIVPLKLPPPIVAAPLPGPGSDPSAGDADVRGPGTGSGGRGRGNGDGYGDGDGDAGGGTPPRWLRGRISDRDYPRWAGEAGIGGTVSVRYRVGIDGRVSDCVVTRSSGSRELDEVTCRLIEQRFRFAPSRDRTGRAVRSTIVEDHHWMVRDEEWEE